VTISEKDCRAGLEACLLRGWLRVVDQSAENEVQVLLREEPAMQPVPCEADISLGMIDFTPGGAALYKKIAAEWLGTDWEDNLRVWKEFSREEHRYCEAKEGLQGIVEQYIAQGENVLENNIVAIGPWCVYWWERFPSGFRLELKIGSD
jgi:hypothetical protein